MPRGKVTASKISKSTYRGDHLIVATANAKVHGNHCTIEGPNARVWGNHNTGTGPNIEMWGNHNRTSGPNATLHGNYCVATGPNSTVIGRNGYTMGPNSRVLVDSGTTVASGVGHAEASDGGTISFNFSGSDYLCDNGNVSVSGNAVFNGGLTLPRRRVSVRGSGNTITGGNLIINGRPISTSDDDDDDDDGAVYTSSVVFSGGGMVVTINKNGRPYARYEGSGNIDRVTNRRIIVDGNDITEACLVDVSSSSERKRKNKEDAPTPKRVLPEDHKCSEAKDDEKECVVCQDNRVDARLDPCGHTVLCVDCATKIYSDSSKRCCPVCNKSIERVDVAFL